MVQPEPVQVSLPRFHPECLDKVLSGSCAADPEVSAEPCTVPASGELILDLMLAPMETVLLLIDRNTI